MWGRAAGGGGRLLVQDSQKQLSCMAPLRGAVSLKALPRPPAHWVPACWFLGVYSQLVSVFISLLQFLILRARLSADGPSSREESLVVVAVLCWLSCLAGLAGLGIFRFVLS